MASTSAAAAVPISEARSFDLTIDGPDLEEDNAFGDTWRTHVAGIIGWSISVEANYDTADNTAFLASTQNLGPVRCYAYHDQSVAARFYSGFGWIRMNTTGNVNSKGTYTIDVTGDGALAAA